MSAKVPIPVSYSVGRLHALLLDVHALIKKWFVPTCKVLLYKATFTIRRCQCDILVVGRSMKWNRKWEYNYTQEKQSCYRIVVYTRALHQGLDPQLAMRTHGLSI